MDRAFAQIEDPVPEPIEPSGHVFEARPFITLPSTSQLAPKARINMLRPVPGFPEVLAVNDLRGLFYLIRNGDYHVYLNLRGKFDPFIDAPGKGTGFGAFAFHPAFAENGIFYTSHAEEPGSGPADFTPAVFSQIALQWVITEWKADDPAALSFTGTRREILRMDFPDFLHGIQEITFNPTVSAGEADYGNLYICIGDGGSSKNFQAGNLQSRSAFLGTIFRIDPSGTNGAHGQYGIPVDNPYVSDPAAVQEVWVSGFRNPHRICWDPAPPHQMYISDIGEMNIEEINIGVKGANYGWSFREGTFLYDRAQGREHVFPLPPNDSIYGYTYPVAMYDHDEGFAIAGGLVYRGSETPVLQGHYLFGDILNGRIWILNTDDVAQGTITPVYEIFLEDTLGTPLILQDLENNGRADLRFGYDATGEIYLLTKADGTIRTLHQKIPSSGSHPAENAPGRLHVFPNPAGDLIHLDLSTLQGHPREALIFDMTGKCRMDFELPAKAAAVAVRHLPPGCYTIRVWTGGGNIAITRFIKN